LARLIQEEIEHKNKVDRLMEKFEKAEENRKLRITLKVIET